MKKILSAFLAVILVLSCAVPAFAETLTWKNAEATRDAELEDFYAQLVKFDVNSSGAIDAGDARSTLRKSAGLADSGVDVSKMDVDGDGEVTAIDARSILRISAGLDSATKYISKADMLDCFNSLVNLPRAVAASTAPGYTKTNYYHTYANSIKNVGDVTVKEDSNKVITKLNNGLNDYSSDDEEVDFEDTLTKSLNANTSTYTSSGNSQVRAKDNYYIADGYTSKYILPEILNSQGVDERTSSYLTVDDIDSIEYKTNQTYEFTRNDKKLDTQKNIKVIDTSKVIYKETVTGLDSITVKLKTDNNVAAAHTSKAFLVESEADITESLTASQTEMEEMEQAFKEFEKFGGEFKFDMTAKLDSINYNSSITVYFNPSTKDVVAIKYGKTTHYTVKMYMDVYIKILLSTLVDAAGNVYITNVEEDVDEYYFYNSNSDNHTNIYYPNN
ncbi:MAG: hypothetical protein IJZ35_06470 [Clostridia bacterium]|nr:hypothetical protein [Clostridia bacterium]